LARVVSHEIGYQRAFSELMKRVTPEFVVCDSTSPIGNER
jgi:hypothetical protein